MEIVATGMVCSVGLTAASACAAMRAGIARFDELPYHDRQGEPIVGATVPGRTVDMKRGQHLTHMLAMALEDCLGKFSRLTTERVPLLVGLAEPGRPGGGADLARSIILDVQYKLGRSFHPTLSRQITSGHTAGFEGLKTARELLKDSTINGCIVAGTDSYINASSLLWLDQNFRLKRPDHSNGVIPGEAAAAVYVERGVAAGQPPAVKLVGLGFSTETANVMAEEPLLGIGLANAAKAALTEAGIQMHDLDFRISDVTGESYGFKELSLALGRLMRVRREELPLWQSADCVGDIGAAAGICQWVVLDNAFKKGYAPGKRVISYSSSISGQRAVAIFQR